ncbi:MAG: host-nuclease inhibitor Gam family protein [Syntrophobacteraceae bacterium]|nr:host-nuclease inhibitor Gam family protein [Syntrophobacteraceae bacterium]
MKRIKQKAVDVGVPQTREAVIEAIAEIGRRQRERDRIETEMNEELSAIKARYEEMARPHVEAVKALTTGVQIWCEANRNVLTQGGKVKYASFETGEVRWRTTPPKVIVRGVDQVIEQLRSLGLMRFIRLKEEVNKEAILSEPEAVVMVKGISIAQSEDFVVEPFKVEIT